MQADAKPRIEITVDEDGVDGVKLYAATPEGAQSVSAGPAAAKAVQATAALAQHRR